MHANSDGLIDKYRAGRVIVYIQECYQNVNIDVEICTAMVKVTANFNSYLSLLSYIVRPYL